MLMNTKLQDEEAAVTKIQGQMEPFLNEDELRKRLQADGADLPIIETKPRKHTPERRIWDWIHWWNRREDMDKILSTARTVFHKQLRMVANF